MDAKRASLSWSGVAVNIVIVLLVVAIVLVLLGALVKALLWLLFIGVALAVGAFLYGAAQRRRSIDRR